MPRRTGRSTGRRTGRRLDDGLSLVEVVVAAGLSSLVIAGTLSVFTGAMRSVRAVSVRTSASADTRIAMEQVTRELRVATRPDGTAAALVSGTDSSLSFYSLIDRSGTALGANADVSPTRIDYAFNGSCVTGTATPMLPNAGGGWTLDGPHAVTRCLLRAAVAPRFRYYPTGAISLNGVDTPALSASAGLATSDLPLVQSIEVTLTSTSAATADIPAAQLRSRVTLTNVLLGAGS
jgi:hypothetical protein